MAYRAAPPMNAAERALAAWLAQPSRHWLEAPVLASERRTVARLLREHQSLQGAQLVWLWVLGLSLIAPPLWLLLWLTSRLPIAVAERLSVGIGALLLLFLGELVWFSARAWLSQRALSAEERWLARLPVPVSGYLDLLQVEPGPNRRFSLRLSFRDEPRHDLVEALVTRFSPQAQLSAVPGEERMFCLRPAASLDNLGARRWLRGAMQELVLPLHRAYPLALAQVTED